ncbi:MAG: hypothetical protein ABIT76_14040 [Chthoniobacterales bacterium]
MISRPPESWQSEKEPGLSSLELLGAYFTSQLHDLNNQMAVLSNSELFLPATGSPEVAEFLQKLFGSIHRLSATCAEFNAIRKMHPVEVESVSLQEAVEAIIGAVGDGQGWNAQSKADGDARVLLNLAWLPMIISELITDMQTELGSVEISIGLLPPRQYQHALRSLYGEGPDRGLLVHFKGRNPLESPKTASAEFQIAMELVRLLGAAVSLSRSDTAKDYLLAFRLQP